MARAVFRIEPLPQERIEALSLEERLEAVSEAIASELVPGRLLRDANALQSELLLRQRRNLN